MADTARKKALYRDRQSGRRPLNIPAERTCRRCGETKPASEFRRSFHNDSGLEARCRSCVSASNRVALYGLSQEEYDNLLAAQGGVCAICGQPETTRANNGLMVKDLAVDHDHATGTVRGLLCAQCNKGIGNLGEDPDRLVAAAAYLLRTANLEVI